MTDKSEQLKTGTTTVVVKCKDGIVMAADRRVTAGMVKNRKFRKINKVNDRIALSMAGTVSDAQLLIRLLNSELKLKDIQTDRKSSVKEAGNLLANMVYSNFRRYSIIPGITSFMIAGMDDEGFHAYNIGIDGSVIDIDEYESDGSGSVFAYGVLENKFKEGLSVDDGVKLAVDAIDAAQRRDTASGDGVLVLTVTSDGAEFVMDKLVETHINE